MGDAIVGNICGKALSEGDLDAIRGMVREADPPLRAEIARRVCEALGWYDGQGRPKLMSARVGLLRLHRAGVIELPPPRNGNGNTRGLVQRPTAWPASEPVRVAIGELSGLHLQPVMGKAASRLWNGLIERYHCPWATPRCRERSCVT